MSCRATGARGKTFFVVIVLAVLVVPVRHRKPSTNPAGSRVLDVHGDQLGTIADLERIAFCAATVGTVVHSLELQQITQRRPDMIRFSVFYPATDGATFDHE